MDSSPATRPAAASGAPPIPPAVAQRAVEWLVALQAEQVPPALWDEWQHWRAAHPDHQRAWQRIEAVNGQVFDKLRQLAPPVKSAIAQATLTPPHSPARRQAITTLAVLLFAGSAAWVVRERTPWREWVADHRTGPGERHTFELDDGTTLVLNTASAVKVSFTATERRVRLVTGEALVTTARDVAGRPFLIETAQGEAQALGTRYRVRAGVESTDVAVFEGAVRITPRRATAPAQLLEAGQQARFSADAIAAPQALDRDSIAWIEGIIVAKGVRLADFLAELDRYSPRSLSCDPAIADLRVSGSYPLADIDKVLDTLAVMLSLRVESVTRFWGRQSVRLSLASDRQAEG